MYKIPDEYYFPLHHSRSRFKNDAESVLLFMAGEISRIPESDKDSFRAKLNAAIKLYPGNGSASDKTIENWRTEISSLFGLIERDGDLRQPAKIAMLLADHQDLVEFFRYFLYYFQYPGGHLKSQEVIKIIQSGVKFHPAKYLVEVLLEGQKLVEAGNKFGLTKAEATHCIFNDLRVTRDGQSPQETAAKVLALRAAGTQYDTSGDVIRTAGDVLDYMELAYLVKLRPNNQFYLDMSYLEVLQAFVSSNTHFSPYDTFYGKKDIQPSDITSILPDWFGYVNQKLDSSMFQADIISIIRQDGDESAVSNQSEFISEVLSKLMGQKAAGEKIRTKDIGDVGEAIVIEHEKVRLRNAGRPELAKNVVKLPERLALGYDISSYDGVGTIRRCVEVKTTISRRRLQTYNFHLTPSEWSAAESSGELYYIYRLLISGEKVSLFIIQNPVRKYKQDMLVMVPRDGAEVTYTNKSGYWEELLV